MSRRNDKGRLPPFVPVFTSTLDTPAWKALSHGARSLYVALKRRYNRNTHNNGWIYLSQRDAADEIGSHHNEIARWFRELQYYRFIVMRTPGSLGVEGKGKAPHWRLTELGFMRELPTRDFERWNGQSFTDTKTESRAPFQAHRVLESPHTTVPEMARAQEQERAGDGAHIAGGDRAGNPAHTKYTTPPAQYTTPPAQSGPPSDPRRRASERAS